MKSFISEDDIEQAICEHLSQPEFEWTRIACDPSLDAQDVNYRRPDVLLFVNGLPVATPDRTCPHKDNLPGLSPRTSEYLLDIMSCCRHVVVI